MRAETTNILVAGLGGQGVLKASDILADALFRAGYDVKKSELHGMSQRGGSVWSDVRFGAEVASPMIPEGEVDVLLAVSEDQVAPHKGLLREDARVVTPASLGGALPPNRRSVNVALLGVLSRRLPVPAECWEAALAAAFPGEALKANLVAFDLGRETGADGAGSARNTPTTA